MASGERAPSAMGFDSFSELSSWLISGFPRKIRLAMSPTDVGICILPAEPLGEVVTTAFLTQVDGLVTAPDAFCRSRRPCGGGRAKSILCQPPRGGGDALLRGGQRHPHMAGATRAVEVAGRHQDAAGGQPPDA